MYLLFPYNNTMNEMTEQKDVSIPLLSDKLSPDETKDIQIKKTTDIPDYSNEDLYAKANCISRLLFIWGYKIIKLSHKTKYTCLADGVRSSNAVQYTFSHSAH